MNASQAGAEPLDNRILEDALRAFLTAETDADRTALHEPVLHALRAARLAVPTAQPVPVNPDGSLPQGINIPFVAVVSRNDRHGIPAFTRYEALRQTFPNVQHGLVLSGQQIAQFLQGTQFALFIDGPGMHAEIRPEDILTSA